MEIGGQFVDIQPHICGCPEKLPSGAAVYQEGDFCCHENNIVKNTLVDYMVTRETGYYEMKPVFSLTEEYDPSTCPRISESKKRKSWCEEEICPDPTSNEQHRRECLCDVIKNECDFKCQMEKLCKVLDVC